MAFSVEFNSLVEPWLRKLDTLVQPLFSRGLLESTCGNWTGV